MWDNIFVGVRQRKGLVLTGWLLSMLVLLIVAVIFFFVNDYKAEILV